MQKKTQRILVSGGTLIVVIVLIAILNLLIIPASFPEGSVNSPSPQIFPTTHVLYIFYPLFGIGIILFLIGLVGYKKGFA